MESLQNRVVAAGMRFDNGYVATPGCGRAGLRADRQVVPQHRPGGHERRLARPGRLRRAGDTITKATFKLFRVTSNGTTRVSNATVGLGSDGMKATLDPFGAPAILLAKNARYRAVVTTGARDAAGNRLDQSPRKRGFQ